MRPAVDVIIVSHNTRDDLSACLASLVQHPPDPLGTILVVDNASSDGSADLVRRRWPAVRVIALDRNAGFAAANNVAMRQAAAPLLLLLNSDTIVGAGNLDTLTDRLEATGAVAAGPRLIGADGRPEVSFGPMLSPSAELVQMVRVRLSRSRGALARRYVERLTNTERDVDWVSGACLLVRREAALAAGLFDERYFMYEEDVDFCAALRARGGRILYSPHATITHLRGRSVAATAPPAAGPSHYDRSHLAFYEKHAPRWTPLLRGWLKVRGRGIR
jgi:N-acetylglucosaminyl-diphospho-decaprenol L-rhamnosyltransferase